MTRWVHAYGAMQLHDRGGEGVLQILSDRDDRRSLRSFGGFEIFDVQCKLVLQLSLCSGNFCGSEIRHRIVLGLNFGPGIFIGF